MSDMSLIRFLSVIFGFVEQRLVPWLVRMRAGFRESVVNWREKLELCRFPEVRLSWSDTRPRLWRFCSWLGSFILDTFVLLSATAAMLCILYFVW